MVCENKGGREGVLSLTLKTGLSSADAVYARVATRSAGSAMPRMTLIDRKGARGRKERSVQTPKAEKRIFNISLFIYNFATYAHLTNPLFPTPTRASLRGPRQTALTTVAMLFRSLLSPGNRITHHEFVV